MIRELEQYLRSNEVKLAVVNGLRLHTLGSLNLAILRKVRGERERERGGMREGGRKGEEG